MSFRSIHAQKVVAKDKPRSLVAKFKGKCAACGSPFLPGVQIVWVPPATLANGKTSAASQTYHDDPKCWTGGDVVVEPLTKDPRPGLPPIVMVDESKEQQDFLQSSTYREMLAELSFLIKELRADRRCNHLDANVRVDFEIQYAKIISVVAHRSGQTTSLIVDKIHRELGITYKDPHEQDDEAGQTVGGDPAPTA